MSQTEQTDSRRCGTAAGKTRAAHAALPVVSVVPHPVPLALVQSLTNYDCAPAFFADGVHPGEASATLDAVRVGNEFLGIKIGDSFGGVVELIPLSARCEGTIVRIRLALTMQNAAHFLGVLDEVVRTLWTIPTIVKIVAFLHSGDRADDYLAAGFRDEGVLRNAELVAGAWRDVRVLGVSRADRAGIGA